VSAGGSDEGEHDFITAQKETAEMRE